MRKLWITGCIVMICMGMLTACGGNKTEVVPIGDTEEADREVPYAMYINRVEGGKASVTISNYTDEEILYGTDVKWEWLYSTLTDGEYMLTKTVLDPKKDGTYDQATMYVTFVFGTP